MTQPFWPRPGPPADKQERKRYNRQVSRVGSVNATTRGPEELRTCGERKRYNRHVAVATSNKQHVGGPKSCIAATWKGDQELKNFCCGVVKS